MAQKVQRRQNFNVFNCLDIFLGSKVSARLLDIASDKHILTSLKNKQIFNMLLQQSQYASSKGTLNSQTYFSLLYCCDQIG